MARNVLVVSLGQLVDTRLYDTVQAFQKLGISPWKMFYHYRAMMQIIEQYKLGLLKTQSGQSMDHAFCSHINHLFGTDISFENFSRAWCAMTQVTPSSLNRLRDLVRLNKDGLEFKIISHTNALHWEHVVKALQTHSFSPTEIKMLKDRAFLSFKEQSGGHALYQKALASLSTKQKSFIAQHPTRYPAFQWLKPWTWPSYLLSSLVTWRSASRARSLVKALGTFNTEQFSWNRFGKPEQTLAQACTQTGLVDQKQYIGVCHSVGDARSCLAIAKVLAQRGHRSTLLTTGRAAANYLQQHKNPFINVVSVYDFLDISQSAREDKLALSKHDLDKLQHNERFEQLLAQSQAAVIGMPSYTHEAEQTSINKQVLELLSKRMPTAFVCDYLFYDPKHSIAKNNWHLRADRFLAPIKEAIARWKVPANKGRVIGHAAIDDLLAKAKGWLDSKKTYAALRSKVQQKLSQIGLAPKQKYIFVAGGKSGDEAMIEAIVQSKQDLKDLKVVVGPHPGAEQSYLDSLRAIIEKHKAHAAVVLTEKRFLDTDEAVANAVGVMTVTSTVGTTAAYIGKLSGFYQQGKAANDPSVPYVVASNPNAVLLSDSKSLAPFFEQAQQRESKLKDIQELNQSFDQRAADELESLRPKRK